MKSTILRGPCLSSGALLLRSPRIPGLSTFYHQRGYRCVAEEKGAQEEDHTAPTLPPPRSSSSFVRAAPVISYERTRACARCQGTRLVRCSSCGGSGKLPAGGYNARNPVSLARILNSKWTAMERTLGWRHFRVTQKRKQGSDTFLLLVATCDETAQLWVNSKNLKERSLWAAGWLQRTEMRALEEQAGGADCKICKGSGQLACPLCELAGTVVEL